MTLLLRISINVNEIGHLKAINSRQKKLKLFPDLDQTLLRSCSI